MVVVDLFVSLIVGLILWYVVIPFFKEHIFTTKTPTLTGDLGAVEKQVNDAVEAKQQATLVAEAAKKTVEDNLHKMEELKGKL